MREERSPSRAGMGPVRLLLNKIRLFSAGSAPRASDTVPERKFEDRSRYERLAIATMDSGMEPVSALQERSSTERFPSFPKVGGTFPVIALPARERTTSPDVPPREYGMGPTTAA